MVAVIPFTPEQKAVRDAGIGGSEIAAVAGLHPKKSPHDVWQQKTGRSPPSPDTVDSLFGRAMEGGARQLYAWRTGATVELPGTMVHPRYPIVRATPDGIVRGRRKVVEIKCPRYADAWGDDGTQDFPEYFWPQLIWEMAVSGMDRADLVVLVGHERDIRIYPDLPFDAELFDALLYKAEKFWRDHVVADTPPPIDGSDAATAYLRQQFPTNRRADVIQDDSDSVRQWAEQYAKAKADCEDAERRCVEAKNQIIARIGDASGIRGAWGSVSYRSTKGRKSTDWAALCASHGIGPQAIERFTNEGPGYRQFRFTGGKL